MKRLTRYNLKKAIVIDESIETNVGSIFVDFISNPIDDVRFYLSYVLVGCDGDIRLYDRTDPDNPNLLQTWSQTEGSGRIEHDLDLEGVEGLLELNVTMELDNPDEDDFGIVLGAFVQGENIFTPPIQINSAQYNYTFSKETATTLNTETLAGEVEIVDGRYDLSVSYDVSGLGSGESALIELIGPDSNLIVGYEIESDEDNVWEASNLELDGGEYRVVISIDADDAEIVVDHAELIRTF